MATLHERVAARMALSDTVGPHASYATILDALRARFATEDELRTFLDHMTYTARRAGMVPPDWKFLDEVH